MSVSLKIFDETTSGQVYNETVLRLASTRVSVKEIIEQRVRQEVEKFNASLKDQKLFSGLVQPKDAEKELNGYRFKTKKRIDADRQVDKALTGFSSNAYFLLIDDRQVESLDDEFGITETTKISFIKLVPVVGG